MNDNDNIIPLSNIFESNSESKDEDFEMIEIEDDPPKDNNELINLDDIINQDLLLDDNVKKRDYDKIIERIQIGLIIFLFVSAILIYFFGYNFFEPYIKID